MKLACSSWSYHAAFRAGRLEPLEWLRLCAQELEVDGVELLDLHVPSTEMADLRELKRRAVELHLTIAGLACSNDFGDPDRRAGEVAAVQRWCDVAAYLGAPIVRVFSGWPPLHPSSDDGRIVGMLRRLFGDRAPDRRRRTWSDVMWALRQCADYAAERGVVLAVQNNNSHGMVSTAAELWRCVRDVGSPWLRVCLDPADLVRAVGLDQVMPDVVQVHARRRVVEDDGHDPVTHWPEVLRRLMLADYRGFVVLDYEGAEDPEAAVPRAARYMRAAMQLVGRQALLEQQAPPPPGPPAEALQRATVEPAMDTADVAP